MLVRVRTPGGAPIEVETGRSRPRRSPASWPACRVGLPRAGSPSPTAAPSSASSPTPRSCPTGRRGHRHHRAPAAGGVTWPVTPALTGYATRSRSPAPTPLLEPGAATVRHPHRRTRRFPPSPARSRSPSTVGRTALLVIDMQRDFLLPGGFGETLGNDVSQLQKVVPPLAGVLAAARATGMLVIHTREGHLPDLSDCPPAKLRRGKPSQRIGDPARTAGSSCAASTATTSSTSWPRSPARSSSTSPARARSTPRTAELLQDAGITHLIVTGVTTEVCVHTTVREANDRGYDASCCPTASAPTSPSSSASAWRWSPRRAGSSAGSPTPSALLPALAPMPASPPHATVPRRELHACSLPSPGPRSTARTSPPQVVGARR